MGVRRIAWGAFVVLFFLSIGCGTPRRSGDGDAGVGGDVGSGLGGPGDPCTSDAACQFALECLSDVCTSVGGLGEPCGRGDTCEPTLLCNATTCVATVRMRLCHCIYTSTSMTPVMVEMHVGDAAVIGPSLPNVCSPCASVPTGTGVAYQILRSGTTEVLRSGTLDIPAGGPEQGVAFSAGTFEIRPLACDAVPAPFCG